MTTSSLATIIIVLVIAACLVVWLVSVFRADKRPGPGRGEAPRRKIIGGVFRGDPRQMTPRRDAPADVIRDDSPAGQGEHRSSST